MSRLTIIGMTSVISVLLKVVIALRGCLSPLVGPILSVWAEDFLVVVLALGIRFGVADLLLGLERRIRRCAKMRNYFHLLDATESLRSLHPAQQGSSVIQQGQISKKSLSKTTAVEPATHLSIRSLFLFLPGTNQITTRHRGQILREFWRPLRFRGLGRVSRRVRPSLFRDSFCRRRRGFCVSSSSRWRGGRRLLEEPQNRLLTLHVLRTGRGSFQRSGGRRRGRGRGCGGGSFGHCG